jgi:hypothetical protein
MTPRGAGIGSLERRAKPGVAALSDAVGRSCLQGSAGGDDQRCGEVVPWHDGSWVVLVGSSCCGLQHLIRLYRCGVSSVLPLAVVAQLRHGAR